jgi:hypothetical protein
MSSEQNPNLSFFPIAVRQPLPERLSVRPGERAMLSNSFDLQFDSLEFTPDALH